LSLTSPNAPRKRDLLGTVRLSMLAGHRRYAHITALRRFSGPDERSEPALRGRPELKSRDLGQ
jgi:hypothetical protein